LKITSVEIIPVRVPRSKVLTLATYGQLGGGWFEFVLVRVNTDEGISGVGEAPPLPPLSPESQPVIIDMIRSWIAPQLIGMDPFDLEDIWTKMDYVAPTYPMSKAPIDMALWDIKGKTLKTPVHRLLGGAQVKRFPNVGLIGIGSEEEVCREAKRFVDSGYTGLRLKIGPKQDVGNVKALRDVVGDDVTIRVDGNQGYSVHEAVRAIRAMERYGIELVEQPTVWWDFKALAEVGKRVDTPIMPHESIFKASDVKALYDLGAIGALGLKTYRPLGGITNAVKLLDMAKLLGIPCLFHDDVELGVSLAAAANIIAARHRDIKFKCELSGNGEWMKDDVTEPVFTVKDGCVEVPEGPGLGVELDEEKIRKYSTGIIQVKK
jgi:L-alanine-DL-glutamate epimerase-like enolase superfamily enzyme